jgi:O-phosphoseryl-tRNA(Cys) synthetase
MCVVDLAVSNTVSGDVFDFYTMTIFNKLKKPKIELTDQTGRTEEIIAEPTNLVSEKLNYNVRLQVLEKRRDVNLKKKERALNGILVKKGKFDTRDLLATNSVRISVCPSPVLGFKN